MAKKRLTYDETFDEDDELLLDRKAKRKRERELEKQRQAEEARQETAPAADDPMTEVVKLCQAFRWREANVLCLNTIAECLAEDKVDQAAAIQQAQQKIDRSLRRQMIAAFISEAQKMLNKE